MTDNVLRLVDYAPVAVADTEQLAGWAHDWIDALKGGDYGPLASLVLLVETEGGQLAMISQSTRTLDRARLIGLLQVAIHRRLDGGAQIEGLLQD